MNAYVVRNTCGIDFHGKKWYYRLLSNDDIQSSSLMDDYDIDDLVGHLVVCLVSSEKSLCKKDGTSRHLYGYFDTCAELETYMGVCGAGNIFYEIIFGECAQKPHFEIKSSSEAIITTLQYAIIEYFIELIRSRGMDINPETCMIYNTTEYKGRKLIIVRHIIINGVYHETNIEAKACYDHIMKQVDTYTLGQYLECINPKIYGPHQEFLISNKVLCNGSKYGHNLHTMLVSYTAQCVMLPSLAVKSMGEQMCRTTLQSLFNMIFISIRPDWLINPKTGQRMELDCYNDELKLAVEYNGEQHYVWPNFTGQSKKAHNALKRRDILKAKICKKQGIYLISVPYNIPYTDIHLYIKDRIPAHLIPYIHIVTLDIQRVQPTIITLDIQDITPVTLNIIE